MLVGKLWGGTDIRQLGSGNAGGTNALRTKGPWFALWVMVIDVGKGWFASAVLPHISLQSLQNPADDLMWLKLACSAAVVVGHVYPVWYSFKGGKGAATLIGVVVGLVPIAALPVLGVWIGVLALTGYVGLATMVAALAFPVYVLLALHSRPLLLFGLGAAAFVIYTHRSNLARMRAGTENRATRIWLLRPR
jgi:glycerol-3-phosphate acyltransferase PlsY